MKGLKNLRIGAIGARPSAFNTVRYSERIFETNGISDRAIDLSEIFGRINRMKDNDDAAQAKLAAIKKLCLHAGIPEAALLKMAKLGAVIDGWMKQTNLHHQRRAVLDLDGRVLRRRALHHHEHDEQQPHPLRLRSRRARRAEHVHAGAGLGTPSALLDWNNNYGTDPNKCVCFHCSNLPKHFFKEVRMDYQEIIAGTVGKENTFGTCVGRVKSGAMSYARYSTDDRRGVIRGYTGPGQFTDDPLETFGGAGVAEIPQLQKLLNTFAAKASNITWRPTSAKCRGHSRSCGALSGLGEPLPSGA